jgi:hypothetical protein
MAYLNTIQQILQSNNPYLPLLLNLEQHLHTLTNEPYSAWAALVADHLAMSIYDLLVFLGVSH